jgi:DNA polymerase III alpha subunit
VASAFSSLADFAARAAPKRRELEALAEAGALAGIDPRAAARRSALWQVGALERDPRSLFAGVPPPPADSPLPEMTPVERTLADYRRSGITTGPHMMSHLRPELRGAACCAQPTCASCRTGATCARRGTASCASGPARRRASASSRSRTRPARATPC